MVNLCCSVCWNWVWSWWSHNLFPFLLSEVLVVKYYPANRFCFDLEHYITSSQEPTKASSPCQYSLKPSRRGRPRQAKPVCFESWGLCCSQLETIFPWAALHMHPSRRYQGWRCPSSKHALVRNKLRRALCRIDRSIDSQHFSIEKPFSFLSTSCASAAGRENIFSCQWSARVCRVNDRVLHQGPTLFLEKKTER